ncbi:MAG TPA: GWxTD domain-containing protein, partial [Thermoanaerobaculia bacterium]|nr:GWxTD domain-containing protein [Thermoanaerobaculia bacterium]
AQQSQARTAVHFYLAVANSGLRRDDAALTNLEEALRLSPNMRNVDPSKYDANFVKLFARAKGDGGKPAVTAAEGGSGRFEELYPGFSTGGAVPMLDANLERPAVEILGSTKEKRDFRSVRTPNDHARFMGQFWQLRDPSAGTDANEFRDDLARRIAFAEQAFQSPGLRGSMTDRGRVFAVLGVPSLVRRRPLNASDNIVAINRNAIGIDVGTVEYWFYNRAQLPDGAMSQPTVAYRFVTHQGIGDYVLQRDGVPINILTKVASSGVAE